MFAFTERPRLLLKLAPGQRPSAEGRLAVGRAELGISLRPLAASARGKQRLTRGPAQWWIADVDLKTMGASPPPVNAWDLCYRVLEEGAAVGGAKVEFAEPDLEQQWPVATPSAERIGFGESGDSVEPEGQNPAYNRAKPDDWFRNDKHSQLDAARAEIGDPPDDERIRIAHFDTGYDPDHATLPRHLDAALQKNFVDPEFPDDATDRTDGFLTQLGHGTGTLGILAGKAWGQSGAAGRDLGGAPFARVVPIRVANSVVLFRTAAIARAFDYVTELARDPATRVDIVTMSMGGLASQAWAEAINRAYDAGIFIVTAAGNNFGNLPTRLIVYPARFNRVVAACGVQARISRDLDPYADLGPGLMAGNYGPESKIGDAMAAFTPNLPWARIYGGDRVDFNGGGTSAATPQIAAAAAIWIQKNRVALAAYPKGWMRVEAVRHALFESALGVGREQKVFFGRGILQAEEALAVRPPLARATTLKREDKDDARWALIRGLGGLRLAGPPAADRMFELELLQATQMSPTLAETLGDPDDSTNAEARLARFKEALAEERGLSLKVKEWLDADARRPAPATPGEQFLERRRLDHAKNPPIEAPPVRRLRVYTSDPAAAAETRSLPTAYTTIALPWAPVNEGPVDEYFEVVDADPSSGAFYAPVDLDNPHLLATDGLAPSESDPRFHQQMTYAVARTTVAHFEAALGRPALWSPRRVRIGGEFTEQFVRRLRIYPHALREANAFYSPAKKALLFGYFQEQAGTVGGIAPEALVFTCLSYDIIAHETTHALLDGLHRRYAELSNPDTRAFHEAFSDIVALFQHFTHKEALRESIVRAKGRDFDFYLTDLATQFGRSLGYRGALRSALGLRDGKRVTLHEASNEPHTRGAVLLAAIFDAFLDIYRRRSADLVRIATQGTGVLPDGEIHPDLVERLAREAARAAEHLLRMAIRALDYCPPVALTFGEYLRALVSADFDVVPDDAYGYRTAIVSAFRQRGIHPEYVQSVSPDSVRWHPPEISSDVELGLLEMINEIDGHGEFRNWKLTTERGQAFRLSRQVGAHLARQLRAMFEARRHGEAEAERLGFLLGEVTPGEVLGEHRELSRFEVHSVRPARRVMPNGQERLDIVIEITQSCRIPGEGGPYRGGATWIVDGESGDIRYCVRKRVNNVGRIEAEQTFRRSMRFAPTWNYYGGTSTPSEPFALSHRGDQEALT